MDTFVFFFQDLDLLQQCHDNIYFVLYL